MHASAVPYITSTDIGNCRTSNTNHDSHSATPLITYRDFLGIYSGVAAVNMFIKRRGTVVGANIDVFAVELLSK
jgi:hypothetical protein